MNHYQRLAFFFRTLSRPQNKKFRCVAILGITFIALYTLGGFIIAPAILSAKLHNVLDTQLSSKASFNTLSLNPLTFSVTITDIEVIALDSPIITIKKVHLNIGALHSLFKKGLSIQKFHIIEPSISFSISQDSIFNLTNLIPKKDNTHIKENSLKTSTIPAITVHSLAIKQARLSYYNAIADQKEPINFTDLSF